MIDLWNCDNGCGMVGGAGDFYQLSKDDHLMLVCGSCVYDRHLSEWTVDFDSDPRDTVYTLDNLTMINGVVIVDSRRVTI